MQKQMNKDAIRTIPLRSWGRQDPKAFGNGTLPGFTLLEVMVAMAILATAFAAVLRLHSDSMNMVIASRVNTRALELAQYKMTDLELSGLKNLGLQSGVFEDLAPDYEWEVSVEPAAVAPWSRVTVYVHNRQMKSGGVRLTSYMLSGPLKVEDIQ